MARMGRLPNANELAVLSGATVVTAALSFAGSMNLSATILLLFAAVSGLLVIRYPLMAVVGLIATEGFALPLLLYGVDGTWTTWWVFALLLLGAVASLMKSDTVTRSGFMGMFAIFGSIITIGALIATLSDLSMEQVLSGSRILLTPALAAIIGIRTSMANASRLLKFATLVLLASLAASIYQQQVGTVGLLQLGLESGVNVRTYGEELRAPGLFLTNYSLGAYAGVLGGLAWVWWGSMVDGRAKMWRTVAFGASVACLLLSIYRTGLLVLIFSVALWTVFGRGKGSGGRRILAVLCGAGFIIYLNRSGLASSESLEARFRLWELLFARHSFEFFGHGTGYSGSASGSNTAIGAIVVDNYFISLLLQFGMLAFLLIIPLLFLLLRYIPKSPAHPVLRGFLVLASVVMAFSLVDFWEYSSATSLAVFAAAVGYGEYRRNPVDPTERPASHHPSRLTPYYSHSKMSR